MDQVAVSGGTLAYTDQGSGEPVLFIHGGILADTFVPLAKEPALRERYRLIAYHRHGYGQSSCPPVPVSMAQQAADAVALLQARGVERAHIVGHSYGGTIALQLALDAPTVVQSLGLLEPGLLMVPSAAAVRTALARATTAYQAGDAAQAIDGFLQRVNGPGYRAVLDELLPAGWFEQAVADVVTIFELDLPPLLAWEFPDALAQRVTQPVLAFLGSESSVVNVEGYDLMRQWWPHAETCVVQGANHGLLMTHAPVVAAALVGFFARHPLRTPA
jgi:pimeloyl-ACP methyl ester carboxylesterase